MIANAHKLDAAQIENILDKLVPMLANKEDREFFRATLQMAAENSTSSAFSHLVSQMLNR